MPDRIIRDELLESERWLSLKDNADRLAFIALLLRADSLGNFTAEPFRLMRLWRDFGINTVALVAKTLAELADHDLVRLYGEKLATGQSSLLHIPRFGQRNTRYVKRIYAMSPWTTEEQKQQLARFAQRDSDVSATCAPQEKRREEKRSSFGSASSPTRQGQKRLAEFLYKKPTDL